VHRDREINFPSNVDQLKYFNKSKIKILKNDGIFFFVIKLHLPSATKLHYQIKSLVMSLSSSNKVGNPVKKKIVLISHISEGHPLRRLRPLGDK
jgi:hypothetical protein